MNWKAFFTLHHDLLREGPGTPEDVHWALAQCPTPGRVLDAACGPGADTMTLAEALPEAQITAIDLQDSFVAQAQARLSAFGGRVACRAGDMFAAEGPFDLIWCAGAAYFSGVTKTLTVFRKELAPGGHIAFSEPLKPDARAPSAAVAFWQDYPAITDQAGLSAHIAAAGCEQVASRLIVGAAWSAYYAPLQARIDLLRPGADAALAEMLDAHQREIDLWRQAPDHVAYVLTVVKPIQAQVGHAL